MEQKINRFLILIFSGLFGVFILYKIFILLYIQVLYRDLHGFVLRFMDCAWMFMDFDG